MKVFHIQSFRVAFPSEKMWRLFEQSNESAQLFLSSSVLNSKHVERRLGRKTQSSYAICSGYRGTQKRKNGLTQPREAWTLN